ncbi:MAG TPA: glutathione S-transferase [Solirubrobacteraceae bacterium]|jgi:glutathione S-transferase|nr:glutathione S-transferase [Solirubrobacteraceae bacterium]
MRTDTPVLWQLRFSHYNEKARWALDYKGIEHVRRSSLPGPHVLRARRLYGGRTLPALVLDGRAIGDSTSVIEAAEGLRPEPPLYPADPADRRRALGLEDHFDEQLGPYVRRVVFYHLLPDRRFTAEVFTLERGPAATRAYRLALPLLEPVMRSSMGIDREGAEAGRAKTVQALDRIEREAEPDGYMVGGSFTVADLTAAALLSPLVRPAQFSYRLPERWPDAFEAFRDSVKDHPAFAWVTEMYRRHRGTSAAVNE